MMDLAKQKLPFERLHITKQAAKGNFCVSVSSTFGIAIISLLEMFAYNRLKQQILNNLPDSEVCFSHCLHACQTLDFI
jgi:hypothetical protein